MNDKKRTQKGSQIVISLFVTVTHTAYLDNGTATGLTADNDKIPSESWVVNNSPLEIHMDYERFSRESLRNSRKFYLIYQDRISESLILKFAVEKSQTCLGNSKSFRLFSLGLII